MEGQSRSFEIIFDQFRQPEILEPETKIEEESTLQLKCNQSYRRC